MLAYINDVTLIYYPAPRAEPEPINPGRNSTVHVQFDGINHFVRLYNPVQISQQELNFFHQENDDEEATRNQGEQKGWSLSQAAQSLYHWWNDTLPEVTPKAGKIPPEPPKAKLNGLDLEAGLNNLDNDLLFLDSLATENDRVIQQIAPPPADENKPTGCCARLWVYMASCGSRVKENSPRWNYQVTGLAAISLGVLYSILKKQDINGVILGSNVPTNNSILYDTTAEMWKWLKVYIPMLSTSVSTGVSTLTSYMVYRLVLANIKILSDIVAESRARIFALETTQNNAIIPTLKDIRDLVAIVVAENRQHRLEIEHLHQRIDQLQLGAPAHKPDEQSGETKLKGKGLGLETDAKAILLANTMRGRTKKTSETVKTTMLTRHTKIADQKKASEMETKKRLLRRIV